MAFELVHADVSSYPYTYFCKIIKKITPITNRWVVIFLMHGENGQAVKLPWFLAYVRAGTLSHICVV